MSFQDKVVIVTGASSGIGAAIAIKFAEQKAKVVLAARTESKLRAVSKKCKEYNVEPLVIITDVTKESDIKNVITKTISNYGKIDILINNAGIFDNATIMDYNALQVFDKVMATNLRSAVFLTKLATPYLVETKGNIVNISSIAAVDVLSRGNFAYCVSKAALDHFTRCMALDLGPRGVRVNSVNPGPVETNIFNNIQQGDRNDIWKNIAASTIFERVSAPEEIADLVLFVTSDKAKAITGSSFFTDNGFLLKREINLVH